MTVPSLRSRAATGIADQIISSGTNFATGFVAGRLLDATLFAQFVIALSAAYIALGVQRALVGDPLLAYSAGFEEPERRRMAADATATALWLGVLATGLGVAAWATGWSLTRDMIWLAPWIPAVLVQDAGRYVYLAARRPDQALVLDVIWALVQAATVLGVWLLARPGPGLLAAAWGFGALAGALASLAISRRVPWRGSPRAWARESGHLSGWFTPTAILSQTQYQAVLFLVGGLLSADALGGLRGIQLVILQPVQTVMLAVTSLMVPHAARLYASGDRKSLSSSTWRLGAVFLVLGLATVVLVPLRAQFLQLVLPKYVGFAAIVPAIVAQAIVYAFVAPFVSALRGLQRARDLFVIQVLFALLTIAGVIIGARWYGVVGAAWGLTIASVGLVVGTIAAFVFGVRPAPGSTRDEPLPCSEMLPGGRPPRPGRRVT